MRFLALALLLVAQPLQAPTVEVEECPWVEDGECRVGPLGFEVEAWDAQLDRDLELFLSTEA